MIPYVTNHLWQSTWFAAAMTVVTLAFRSNRAHVRFCLWFAASAKFLVPFAMLLSLGSRVEIAPGATRIAAPAVPYTMLEISEPFALTASPARPTKGPDWVPFAVGAVWACGFGVLVLMRLRGWLRVRAALRSGVPGSLVDCPIPVRYSPGLLEPGVVGMFRPILLLPAGIEERLTTPQMRAVAAHEVCHVRRRDNLLAAVHMAVEAMFWFHPLIWWIGAKLVEERERACDEEVLRQGSDPAAYAEGILNICKIYAESPLACVSGVTGADLKKRIEAIMRNRGALRLNLAKKMLLAGGGAVAVAAPVLIGVVHAPTIRAQSAAGAAPKFEVISIKPCSGEPAPMPGRKGGRGGRLTPSPGRFSAECATLETLVRTAYIQYPEGKPLGFLSPHTMQQEVKGRPSWYGSARYSIEATTEGPQPRGVLLGPMLQSLLEERFHLKLHYETRDTPIYELRVGKSGAKLPPAKEGSCVPFDREREPDLGPGAKPLCGFFAGRNMYGATMDLLTRQLTAILDRDVVNKTGIEGTFDIRFEYPPDDLTPAGAGPAPPSPPGPRDGSRLATMLEYAIPRLGLVLQPATGSGKFLVIDHVEKPAEN